MQHMRVKSTSRLLQLLVGGMALHRDYIMIRGVQRGAAACLCLPPRQACSAAAAGIQPSKPLLQRSKTKKQPKAFELIKQAGFVLFCATETCHIFILILQPQQLLYILYPEEYCKILVTYATEIRAGRWSSLPFLVLIAALPFYQGN